MHYNYIASTGAKRIKEIKINVFKVTCADGNSWATAMNATLDQATIYFFGYMKFYITEDFDTGKEIKSQIISVVQT